MVEYEAFKQTDPQSRSTIDFQEFETNTIVEKQFLFRRNDPLCSSTKQQQQQQNNMYGKNRVNMNVKQIPQKSIGTLDFRDFERQYSRKFLFCSISFF